MSGTAAAKADLVFSVYVTQGVGRSLARVHEALASAGVRISLATLKRYSTRFRWVNRTAELDAEVSSTRRGSHLGEVLAMRERHAQIARAMQAAGGNALQQLMSDPDRLQELDATAITRLLDSGLKAEREAVSDAVGRREAALQLANLITGELVEALRDANEEPDAERRLRLLAEAVDRIVSTSLKEEAA